MNALDKLHHFTALRFNPQESEVVQVGKEFVIVDVGAAPGAGWLAGKAHSLMNN